MLLQNATLTTLYTFSSVVVEQYYIHGINQHMISKYLMKSQVFFVFKKKPIHNCFNPIAHCAEIPNLCAPQSIHPVASTTTVHWQRLYCIHGSRQILGNESSLVLQRTKHAERELMKRLFNANVQKNYHMIQEPQEGLEIWGYSQ